MLWSKPKPLPMRYADTLSVPPARKRATLPYTPYPGAIGGSSMKLSAFLLIVVCGTGIIGQAQDDSVSAVRSRIIALEKAWNQAYKAGDTRALDSILDNEIVLINDDGSVQTKAEFLASVKTTQNNSQEQQVSPESMSVHVFGNTAISTGVFRAKGVEDGKSYVRRERFVDTWLFKDSKWVCVASNATPILH
jgi:ketosteroid isomerase-like protein